jgi:hypothetical protein
MDPSITLPTAPYEHPAMDYTFLRQEGIRHLERMAGHLWTDFNVHDPGITILEQLCYAITDLANRIDYEIPDLLASAGKDAYASLYSPGKILTTHPVTLNDLRKLVIDVEGVKNAWIEPVAAQKIPLYFDQRKHELALQDETRQAEPIYLKGLYRVLIEISDLLYLEGTVAQGEIRRKVLHRLHAHRAICEDFEEVQVLEPQPVTINARIEIGPVDDPEALLLQIYQRLANAISPAVPFYTLSQLLDAGEEVDEIFDGPLLAHGFIRSEDLRKAQRHTVLRTSDLIRQIMDVPGVRAVRMITISTGAKPQEWSLRLDPDRAPKLNLTAPTILLERKGLEANVDREKVLAGYNQWLRQAAHIDMRGRGQNDLLPPQGRARSIGDYYSFQHQFPANYGIGAYGLPDSASAQRKSQARQLKAYLLFFDQLLANSFAQLANVGALFSFSEATTQTYFSQAVDDPELGLEEIRRSTLALHQARLQQIAENPYGQPEETALRRRNRLLNHLLARFAEHFTDYSLILYSASFTRAASSLEKLVLDKQLFLQNYPAISSARGAGSDYLQAWSSDNRSGLERRIARKLGFGEGEIFYLVEHILLRPVEGDQQQQIPLLAEPRHQDPYSLQVSFVFPAWLPRFADPAFRQFTERTVREETPAHLAVYLHCLDQPEMAAFEVVYRDWLNKRRTYWIEKLGA